MAIIKKNDGMPPLRGGLMGGRAQSVGGSTWLSGLHRSAKKSQTRGYTPTRNFELPNEEWDFLDLDTRALWDEAALTLPLYTRFTAAILSTGKQLFLNYNANNRFFNEDQPIIYTPPEPPTWGPAGSFADQMYLDAGNLWMTVSKLIPSGTKMGVYAMRPSQSGIGLNRAQVLPCGTVTAPEDLTPGYAYSAPGSNAAATLGPLVLNPQWTTWFTIYEVEGGFIRLLSDPCKPQKTLLKGIRINLITYPVTVNARPQPQPCLKVYYVGLPTQFVDFPFGPITGEHQTIIPLELNYPSAFVDSIEVSWWSDSFGPGSALDYGAGPDYYYSIF